MRLYEHEAKRLLKGYGIPIPPGRVIRSIEEIVIESPSVLKAQILAGGRKKSGGLFLWTRKRRRSEKERGSSEQVSEATPSRKF